MQITPQKSYSQGRTDRILKAIILFLAIFLILLPETGAKVPHTEEPVLIKMVNPVYPSEFAKTKVETTVELFIVINENGEVTEASVLSAPHVSFGNAALGAVRQWRFKPAMKEGKPILVRRVQPIFFSYLGRKLPAKTVNLSRISKSRKIKGQVYPEILDHREPVYPFDLLSKGVNGSATINFVVGESGTVLSAQIQKQSLPEFGYAATAAIMHWRFEPGKKDGQPIPFALQQEFTFHRSYFEPAVRNWVRKLKQSKADFIIKPKNLDKIPRIIFRENPVFPPELQKEETEGKAKIRFIVDTRGRVWLPRVEEATDPLFGYAAAAAISAWKFEPPLKNDEPVITEFVIPMAFKL